MKKNNISIEELERQYADLGALINKRKQEEENMKRVRLDEERTLRRLEIADKQSELMELITAFLNDYGYFDFNNDEFPYLWYIFI